MTETAEDTTEVEYVPANLLQARFAARPASTPDDVGIRLPDGRHLRTRSEVLAFVEALDG